MRTILEFRWARVEVTPDTCNSAYLSVENNDSSVCVVLQAEELRQLADVLAALATLMEASSVAKS